MPSEAQILKLIARQPKRAAGFKQLVRELGLHGDERTELNDKLQRMVAAGQLLKADSDRYAVPSAVPSKNMIIGRLSMHRDGYGFVLPDPKSLDDRLKSRLAGDIFIPPPFIGTAMHGDRVLVEVGTIRPDGRAEGHIIRPVDRAHATVVGKFHYGSRHNYVMPIDEKIRQEIIIPPGMEFPETASSVVGHRSSASAHDAEGIRTGEQNRGMSDRSGASAPTANDQRRTAGKHEPTTDDRRPTTASPHRVLGNEAARRNDYSDLENVVVDVEITDWPSPTQSPRGKVVEILGYEDDFGVDVEIMIRKFHLPHRFPAAVLAEAEGVENIIPAPELRRRRDYRDLPIVTIDGETARDFDDAVHVRRLDNGNYELQVHIADVAQYVRPGSALDQEACLRGTSVYFPDRAVPMLPFELSTDICSLRPQVDRLVLSCVMEIDHRGEVVGYEINEGVIRSAERMTYTAVNAVIEGDLEMKQRYAPLVAEFERMRDLALLLNRKRHRRGSIDFDLPEPVIEFDELGMMKSVTRSERNVAHRLIEEFMLSANECVAHYLENRRIASLYRIHEKPEAKRVYDFEVIAATFGYSLGVGALPIQRIQLKGDRRNTHGTGRNTREIEIPKEVHITPRMYQKLTEKIAGKPEERILSYLMLRSLKQARYSEENEGHFALAATTYTHFTSPIRRYPDLIVHRILKDVLHDSPDKWDGEVPVGISGNVSFNQGDEHEQGSVGRTARPGNPAGESADSAVDGRKSRQGHEFSRAEKHGQRKGASASASDGPRRSAQHSTQPSPWSKRRDHAAHQAGHEPLTGPIPLEQLHDIADESSQAERRADEAERELMEWKKVKFMQDRVGEDFDGLIISVTKFGFFVELAELFVEGLVPLASLTGDRYIYHENTREIVGERTRTIFRIGQPVRVLLDRIDPVEKKLQFALLEELPPRAPKKKRRK
jgi:ribonuclease R